MSEWFDAKKTPPRKDIPIIVYDGRSDFPSIVKWSDEGIYGDPAYVENNGEYVIHGPGGDKDAFNGNCRILYWMPAPMLPKEI